jgi:hypothetical protein
MHKWIVYVRFPTDHLHLYVRIGSVGARVTKITLSTISALEMCRGILL